MAAAALVGLIGEFNIQIAALEHELVAHFDRHPSAVVYRSLPGLGGVLGARVLAEFGDDATRYSDAKSRKNYASTSPVPRASVKSAVVHARFARNIKIADACRQWAFCSLANSPGARAYYDVIRARDKSHEHALRQLANRWIGILHGCLSHNTTYEEATAWSHWMTNPSTAEKTRTAA